MKKRKKDKERTLFAGPSEMGARGTIPPSGFFHEYIKTFFKGPTPPTV